MEVSRAIDLIDEKMCWGRGTFSVHHMPEYDEYWQAGEMAIEALKKQEEDKWTLTSERFPKREELVWVCDKHHEVAVCKLLAEYENGDWYDSNDEWFYYRDSVIAWRPYLVPEPYKPEEEVKDGWHPVSEDPPKKESHYWVQLCNTDGNYAGMCECNWTDAGYVFPHTKTDWHWVKPQFTKVVAWRKLPDIYTEEEQ